MWASAQDLEDHNHKSYFEWSPDWPCQHFLEVSRVTADIPIDQSLSSLNWTLFWTPWYVIAWKKRSYNSQSDHASPRQISFSSITNTFAGREYSTIAITKFVPHREIPLGLCLGKLLLKLGVPAIRVYKNTCLSHCLWATHSLSAYESPEIFFFTERIIPKSMIQKSSLNIGECILPHPMIRLWCRGNDYVDQTLVKHDSEGNVVSLLHQ